MVTDDDTFFIIIYIAVLGVMPLFAGALKGYSANGIVRILARFAAPTSSALLITYVVLYHGLLLSPFGITFDNNPDQGVAIPIIMSFVALLWFLFYKFVSFGETIGQEEDTGLRADGNQITRQVNHIITPTLDNFTEKIQEKTEEKLEDFTTKLEDTIIPEIKKVTQNQHDIQENMDQLNANEEERKRHQMVQDNHTAKLIENQHDQNDILATVREWLSNNPNQYEILLSRIEAINLQQNNMISNSNYIKNHSDDSDTDDEDSNAKLTTMDGIANRVIGHKKQQEMAQYLRDVGFDIIDGHGAGQPDFIIKKKKILGYDLDGTGREEKNTMEIVAVGSNKSYTLKDQPKKKQRRISADDCIPEITLAKKLHIPMIILVTNRNNSRRWAAKISYDELVHGDGKEKKWSGISTPVMLSQDDPESAQELEEKFCSVLASIGASV